jgi:hypothetical protein
MPLLANINVGSAPNDGTGDTIRDAFTIVNENFQFIESFFPNTDVANLTANITSTGTSTFNNINAATVGNTGTVFTGASLSAATIGNSGSTLTGSTVNAATIGNTGAAVIAGTVSAATIGNTGSALTGTLTTASQPNINSIGTSVSSNVAIIGNVNLSTTTITGVRAVQHTFLSAAGGTYYIGMDAANTQCVNFFMNANVNVSLLGTIETGTQRDFYFINNSGSTQYADIFVYGNRTNKGTNSISITSNTVTLIKMVATDTTLDNVVAIISNT